MRAPQTSGSRPQVVYVVPVLHPAGAERIVAHLGRRVPGHGFSTSVICLEDEQAMIGRELAESGVQVTGLHVGRRRTLRCAAALRAALPRDRPLIVHAHLFHANLASRLAVAGMPAAAKQGIRTLSTVHVVERRFRPWQFILDRLTAPHAAAEVCVSRAVARFQQKRTGLPATFFPVIENGIDLARFTRPQRPRPQDPDRPHVVSVGRLGRQKDFPTLLRAWQAVNRAMPGARLTIAGEGPERKSLSVLSGSLRLRNVSMPGFVTDIPALLHDADLYVQPSAWEGFGLAVAEAMACGLPVIVSDCDSLPDLVEGGKSGVVVPRGQPAALADAILSLLHNTLGAEKLAQAAHEQAITRFSVDRMVSDYARLYRELIDDISMRRPPK
ncbi:MAG TPA: glycosyltransferase [Tepidisphaeraceae bacterium]|nr:glycosyltransferase [Tepidisphaeraceae bacterium]